MDTNIAAALGGFRERVGSVKDRAADIRDALRSIRAQAPTLTTGLILVVFGAGIAAGWYASKPFTRWTVNAEWRDRIAAASAPVRKIISEGNAEVSATDEQIIEALGDTDAKLSTAENALRSIKSRPATSGECRINADSLRVK